ncbi:putative E3 ubiquitin- ligase DTX3 [Brachionus plicatilis]|nr:putative E3 ubiquitin- ligase DTX3 [Brachionus plicatilis]
MKQSLENVIEKLNQNAEIKTIAIPLLATGLNKGPINLCVDILVDGFIDFEKKGKIKFLKELHLVNIEDTKTQVIVQKLRKIFNINLYHNLRDEHLKSQLVNVQDSGKDDIELPQKNENNEIKINNNGKQCSFCKQKLRKVKLIDCGHSFCVGCNGDKENITKCLIPDCSSNINDKKSNIDVIINKNENNDEKICNICCDTCDSLKKLDKCGHELCDRCFKRIFKYKPQCPFCFIFYGIPTGDQPSNGKMYYSVQKQSLSGYEKYDTIQINYSFPSGCQGKNHPNPGKKYFSTNRTAYLPATEEGFKALNLLKKAFDNNLTFTIGVSVTTGTEGITWNDIHHKTQISGPYGYPDPEYLQRLLEELKAHGIE